MKRQCSIALFAVSAFTSALLSSGCVVKDISSTVEQTVKGDYYLKSKKYDQGKESFRREVLENPGSALAHYYYGRFLLQNGEEKEALEELEQARRLDSDNVKILFWTGVAYGENKNRTQEAAHYRAALRIDKNHLQSLIYLGHSYTEDRRWEDALKLYNRALEIWPGSPSSLYNRALILRKLGRTPEERVALHQYLALYPSGAMARRATVHLNGLDDFTYRNHHLGARTITLEKIWFEPLSAKLNGASNDSLRVIGNITKNMEGADLQIVCFQKNNLQLAKQRARAIKGYLLEEFPEITPNRIGISWFAEPQVIEIKNKKKKVEESVSFFTTARK